MITVSFASFAFNETSNIESPVQIFCENTCDKKQVVKTYLDWYPDTKNTQVFDVFMQGYLDESFTLSSFKFRHFPEFLAEPEPYFDHPLSCENDPHYTCEDWASNEIAQYLNGITLEFTVTQEFIDGVEGALAALDLAANTAVAVALAVPAMRVSSLIMAKYTNLTAEQVARLVNGALAFTSGALTQEVKNFLNTRRSDLQVGDTIKVKNGSVIHTSIIDIPSDGSNVSGDNIGGDSGTGTGGGGAGSNGSGSGSGSTGSSGGYNSGGEQTHCRQWYYINGSPIYFELVKC
ncbi:hypothetical protein [Thalassotalea fusca]